jgi:hypothetical protein
VEQIVSILTTELKMSKRRKIYIGLVIALGLCSGIGWATNKTSTDPRNTHLDIPLTPALVIGSDACAKCHAAEVNAWKQTPHHETFLTLHRKPQAQEIAKKMGVSSFKHDSACIKCHYSMQQQSGALEPIAGVSCESCHGPAKNWVDTHHDYGGPGIKRGQESAEHRHQRLVNSISKGMRNPENVYLVAQSCYRCHTVPDEKLVNVGGHVAGSMNFEMVAWSQGTIRHNFVRSDGKANLPSDPTRLRVLFVSGMIADLEFSLRATAEATAKETFGTTSAGRAARAAKRIAAAQEKVNQPVLAEVMEAFKSVQLKLNNRDQLVDAADRIAEMGVRFAATVDGSQLAALDAFLPKPDQWK